jgi:hypothetical protein
MLLAGDDRADRPKLPTCLVQSRRKLVRDAECRQEADVVGLVEAINAADARAGRAEPNDVTAITRFESVSSNVGPLESPKHVPPLWTLPLLIDSRM